MGNDVSNNPLRTRGDVEKAAIQLLTPLIGLLSPGRAGLHLGDSGAVYPDTVADMEGYSRALWAIVPMLAGNCTLVEPFWQAWREGLVNGTNPEHPEYWGKITGCDQRMVEMAVMAMALCLMPERFSQYFAKHEQQNIYNWLNQINDFDMPTNNWRFFRVLVNAGFQCVGLQHNESVMQTDFALIESHYEDHGWYYDYLNQREYYTPWGYHYYGLVYARTMQARDPERCELYRERARQFAPRFAAWFAADGEALPYGRSMTYRFAQSAFFAAMAVGEVTTPEVDYGVIKGLLLRNMRKWLSRPIFTRDGVLSIGYGYPNLNMAEGYNAPGSPYWALKVFAVLMLPEEHPFWQAREKSHRCTERLCETHARMLIVSDEGGEHVQAFPAGNHATEHAHDAAKYEKFAYSTAFAFSVPKTERNLRQGAFDSMLALSENDGFWHVRYGCSEYELTDEEVSCTWHPFAGVTVRTRIIPKGDWHLRIHEIKTSLRLRAAEGGYAIRRENGVLTPTTVEDGLSVAVHAPWGTSGIVSIDGYQRASLLSTEPNTNLLYSRTLLPTLEATLEPGTTRLVCAVLGAVNHGEEKWSNPPKEEI